jgi:hypothetical protein
MMLVHPATRPAMTAHIPTAPAPKTARLEPGAQRSEVKMAPAPVSTLQARDRGRYGRFQTKRRAQQNFVRSGLIEIDVLDHKWPSGLLYHGRLDLRLPILLS